MTQKTDLAVGTKISDGTIYAGELNGKSVYAAPEDATTDDHNHLMLTFRGAAEYVERMNKVGYLGHNDWHVATKNELNLLEQHKHAGALKGTFNENGRDPAHWYTSSTGHKEGSNFPSVSFTDGNTDRDSPGSVRLVRSVSP